MVIAYVIIGLLVWFILDATVLKIGLLIQDKIHREAIKKWKMDIEDYEHNRFKFKLYVTLFFVGIPILYFVGFIIYFHNGLQ